MSQKELLNNYVYTTKGSVTVMPNSRVSPDWRSRQIRHHRAKTGKLYAKAESFTQQAF
ncbi:MAG: hypothetical protein ACYTXE_33415 [Nostoc sp.]